LRPLAKQHAAFGPATVKDIQIWSGLARLQEVIDHLTPKLCRFRSDQGDKLGYTT
jgi:hypothetical protein